MESVIPTIEVKVPEPHSQHYKVLGLTVNPLFFVARRRVIGGLLGRTLFLPRFLPPTREFQVWIELVLGHDASDLALDFPEIEFVFNDALRASDSDWPYRQESAHCPFLSNCENYELYSHFWFRRGGSSDLLTSAYGSDARRIVPRKYRKGGCCRVAELKHKPDWPSQVDIEDDAQFALAFKRSAYRLGSGDSPIGQRWNYPCSFQITSESDDDSKKTLTVLPRPFELETGLPSCEKQKLRNQESVSFWFYYTYSEQTAVQADAPDHDLFSFIHKVTLNKDDLHPDVDVNVFPRFPYRFRTLHSNPTLIVSPYLERDPPTWIREEYAMYPMVIASELDGDGDDRARNKELLLNKLRHNEFVFFFSLKDERTQWEKNVGAVFYSILVGVLMNFIANFATADTPFKNPWDVIVLVVLGIASGLYTYALFATLRGRVGGFKEVFLTWETQGGSEKTQADAEHLDRLPMVVATALVGVAVVAVVQGFTGCPPWPESLNHLAMIIFTGIFVLFGLAGCCFWYGRTATPPRMRRSESPGGDSMSEGV